MGKVDAVTVRLNVRAHIYNIMGQHMADQGARWRPGAVARASFPYPHALEDQLVTYLLINTPKENR